MAVEKHILWVEDDSDDREIFSEICNKISNCIKCVFAANATEALSRLDAEPAKPNLIILDVNLPGINGLSCLSKLKSSKKFNEIPVAMVSTSKNPAEIETAMNLGAVLFLTKSVCLDHLEKKIKNMFLLTGLM